MPTPMSVIADQLADLEPYASNPFARVALSRAARQHDREMQDLRDRLNELYERLAAHGIKDIR